MRREKWERSLFCFLVFWVFLSIVCFSGCAGKESSPEGQSGKNKSDNAVTSEPPSPDNEMVSNLVKPFSAWLIYNVPQEILASGFTDNERISVVHFLVSHPYNENGGLGEYYYDDAGDVNGKYYHKWKKDTLDGLLIKYFGSGCKPDDNKFREAGFEIEKEYVMLPAAEDDHGGRQLSYDVLDVKKMKEGCYKVRVEFYDEQDPLDFVVAFIMQYDRNQDGYYIANIVDDAKEMESKAADTEKETEKQGVKESKSSSETKKSEKKKEKKFAVKEKEVRKMVEIFDMWVINALYREEIAYLSDTDRIEMSYDLLRSKLYDYSSNNEGLIVYDREEAENLMRSYFGKDFRPTDYDYESSGFGFEVNNDTITCGVGDWGMEGPEVTVQEIRRIGDYECEADILYKDPNFYDEDGDGILDMGRSYLATWVFALNENLKLDYIKDVSISLFSSGSEYYFPYSDKQYIEEYELEYLTTEDLFFARNEIFARHGRKFKNEMLQNYFNSCNWYQGLIEPDDFSSSVLNKYEKKNVETILKEEKARNSPYVPN